MGPIWDQQDPGGPHVDPMNLAIRVLGTNLSEFGTKNINIFLGIQWDVYHEYFQAGKVALTRSPMAGRVENRPGRVEFCIGYIRDYPVRVSAKNVLFPSLNFEEIGNVIQCILYALFSKVLPKTHHRRPIRASYAVTLRLFGQCLANVCVWPISLIWC